MRSKTKRLLCQRQLPRSTVLLQTEVLSSGEVSKSLGTQTDTEVRVPAVHEGSVSLAEQISPTKAGLRLTSDLRSPVTAEGLKRV